MNFATFGDEAGEGDELPAFAGGSTVANTGDGFVGSVFGERVDFGDEFGSFFGSSLPV